MANDDCMTFQQRGLFQQGYQQYSPDELKQLEWGLRFTPAACSLIAAYGLYTQQPAVLFSVAVLGFWAFFFPAAHPMDLFYNHVLRHPFKAVKLPENPFQRRLACLSAGVMNLAAGVLFILDFPVAALIVGITLLILQTIVITTHFCTLSWMYEGAMRFIGKWQLPLSEAKAKEFVQEGAVLVDVRSQNEFAKGSVDGAVNLPLEEIGDLREEALQDKFKDSSYLLFCASGTRSHIATEKLKALGFTNIYNIGDLGRAQAILS